MDRGARFVLVTFESLSRTTAAGNHIAAVQVALSECGETLVCGSTAQRVARRYAGVVGQWALRSRARDTLYVRNHPVSPAVVVMARLRRQQVVLEVNGPPEDIVGAHRRFARAIPALRWGLRRSLGLARRIIVPTPGLADYVRAMCPGADVVVIPAGFDDGTFRPAPGGPDLDRPYAVFVGANAAWQGIGTLMDAVAHPDWPEAVRLVLVGPFGDLAVPGTVPSDRVETAGVLAPGAVAALLRGALVALSPKTYQTTDGPRTGQAPLKVYEALGSGVPCIVTDVPIQNDLIRGHECGIVVDVGDAPAVARAVGAYAADRDLRARHGANAAAASVAYGWTHLANVTRAAVCSGT